MPGMWRGRDWMSAIIPSIALGVAVDGTIHIGTQFRHSLASGLNPYQSARRVIVTIGKALTATSLTLCAGFTVFGLSNLSTLSRLGMLMSFCVALDLIADLFMTPAILCLTLKGQKPND